MFTVRKVTAIEHYCPNGHTPLPDLLPENDHSVKFCHVCGTPIEEKQARYDAAYCGDCCKPVSPDWNYCPYCGQGREKEA